MKKFSIVSKFMVLSLLLILSASCVACSKDNNKNNNQLPPEENPNPLPPEEGEVTAHGPANPGLWAATDPLDRVLPDNSEAGNTKSGKTIALFYWTWHDPDSGRLNYASVGNISQILLTYPEARFDADHPAWDRGNSNTHFWGEPLLGYYRTTDTWVLRKHAEMLADAGVDAVFFDCTNAPFLWDASYNALLETWDKAQKDGVNVPKIAFMMPFGPSPAAYDMIKRIYNDLYKSNKYSNLWFEWKGKPCIMAYPESITGNSAEDATLPSFFTYRPGQPDYVNGPSPDRKDQWGWLEVYPQHRYANSEMMTVGVAQNTSPDRGGHAGAFGVNVEGAYGRSYTSGGFDTRPNSYLYGANFQEQWNRALQVSPSLLFITGWNEYIAGRFIAKSAEHPDGDTNWNGKPFSFVDQFDWDRSRDIEPNNEWWGEDGAYMGDTYYYQFITNVRKYKGMPAPEYASEPKTISIGSFNGWDDVAPDFVHYRGNTGYRNSAGHADKIYVSNTGRNDLYAAKVARDDDNIYFYIECADGITPVADSPTPNWMWLMINTDRQRSTGWEGYDYMINFKLPEAATGTVSKNVGDAWEWEDAGTFTYAVKGRRMEIKVPRSALGLDGKIDMEFKWLDNVTLDEDFNISYFYKFGDAAPGARFNFVYTEK